MTIQKEIECRDDPREIKRVIERQSWDGWGHTRTEEHVDGFKMLVFSREETPLERAVEALADACCFTEEQQYALKDAFEQLLQKD